MARTLRNLWPRLRSWDNLLAAYTACRRRKRHKPEATEFHFHWESNLLQLQQEMDGGYYVPGPYRSFLIYEPKRRKISAAPFRDRVVHHAVVRILEPRYERRFIFDSYACRRGKGTHRALERAQQYLRRYRYFLKTDIVRFFPNIDHAVLMKLLGRHIRDRRMLDLIGQIVASGEGVLSDESTQTFFPGDDLFSLLRPRGLPIGNLTSQFFANVLLDQLDHYIKEVLRFRGYVRYADDLVLFADDKETLWKARDAMATQLAAMRLRLHKDKTHVRPSADGLKFLGFKLWPDGRRLQQSAIRRCSRRLRRQRWLFHHGQIDPSRVRRSLQAWLAHAARANTEGICRELISKIRLRRG